MRVSTTKAELYAAIRGDHHRAGLLMRAVERKYGVTWHTIRRAPNSHWPEPRKSFGCRRRLNLGSSDGEIGCNTIETGTDSYHLARPKPRPNAPPVEPWTPSLIWRRSSTIGGTREERDAVLFHELDCPASLETRRVGCGCPCPARILGRIAIHRQIFRRCVQRMKREQDEGVCRPLDSIVAFQTMKAPALPFELHLGWRDTWYP